MARGGDENSSALVPVNSGALVAPSPTLPAAQVAHALQTIASQKEQSWVREAFAHVRSANTARAYRSAAAQFSRWCTARGISALPAKPEHLCLYLNALVRGEVGLEVGEVAQPKSIRTVAVAMAAIAFAHERAYPDTVSPTKSRIVKDTVDGLARQFGKPPKKKRPVLAEMMVRLLGQIDARELEGLRARALVLTGYATAMRRSELITVRLEWMVREAKGWRITIPRSKGDQYGEGQTVGIVSDLDEPALCAVRAIDAWLAVMPGPRASGFLFRRISWTGRSAAPTPAAQKNGEAHVSADDLVAILKQALRDAGLSEDDVKNYAGHSLRAGHITQAHLNGEDLVVIQRQSRHADLSTLLGYIREVDVMEHSSSAALGTRRKGKT